MASATIEDFVSLSVLLAQGNGNLTSLDLSQNTALTSINCNDNQILSLDFSNNLHCQTLIELSCQGDAKFSPKMNLV